MERSSMTRTKLAAVAALLVFAIAALPVQSHDSGGKSDGRAKQQETAPPLAPGSEQMRGLYLAAVGRLDTEILRRHQIALALRDRIRRAAEDGVKLAKDFKADSADDRSTDEELATIGSTLDVVGGFSKTPEAAALLEPESWSVIDLLWELQAELEAIKSVKTARANMANVAVSLGAKTTDVY
jgi:hypothetical protein